MRPGVPVMRRDHRLAVGVVQVDIAVVSLQGDLVSALDQDVAVMGLDHPRSDGAVHGDGGIVGLRPELLDVAGQVNLALCYQEDGRGGSRENDLSGQLGVLDGSAAALLAHVARDIHAIDDDPAGSAADVHARTHPDSADHHVAGGDDALRAPADAGGDAAATREAVDLDSAAADALVRDADIPEHAFAPLGHLVEYVLAAGQDNGCLRSARDYPDLDLGITRPQPERDRLVGP